MLSSTTVLRTIYSWTIVSIVVPLMAGIAFSMLGFTPPRYRSAKRLLSIATGILLPRILLWSFEVQDAAAVLGLLSSIAVFGVWSIVIAWIKNLEHKAEVAGYIKVVKVTRETIFLDHELK